jgi:hypothetical protein
MLLSRQVDMKNTRRAETEVECSIVNRTNGIIITTIHFCQHEKTEKSSFHRNGVDAVKSKRITIYRCGEFKRDARIIWTLGESEVKSQNYTLQRLVLSLLRELTRWQ